jgi:hypothetical protein
MDMFHTQHSNFLLLQKFPKDLFFVLRTVQILRGLSVGMGVSYSCVEEWEGIAREALAEERQECKYNLVEILFLKNSLLKLQHLVVFFSVVWSPLQLLFQLTLGGNNIQESLYGRSGKNLEESGSTSLRLHDTCLFFCSIAVENVGSIVQCLIFLDKQNLITL